METTKLMMIKDDIKDDSWKQNPHANSATPILYFLTFVAQFSIFCEGFEMGSTSGAILLVENNPNMYLNSIWREVIITGAMPSAAISCLFAALFSDRFGRKKCVMFSGACFTLGAIITASATNKEVLLIGRLLTGAGIGFSCATSAVYVAECSPSHTRGRLVSMCQPFLTLGILFGTIIAAVFMYEKQHGWRYIWGAQAIFGMSQILALTYLPESPRWYIQHALKDEARKSLARIRNTPKVNEELQEIEESFKEEQESIANSGGGNILVKMLKTKSVRRALMVGCGLQLFDQFSGVNTIIYFSGTIIHMSGVENVRNAIWDSVGVNSISLVFSIIGIWLVDTAGRRTLAIIGLLGLAFSSLCLGTIFLMTDEFSPWVNVTDNLTNTTCSTYSQCDKCIRDAFCGFCYEIESDVLKGDCLSVNDTSNLVSELGACNSSSALSKHSTKWAFDYCPVSFSWVSIVGLALFLMFYAPGMGPLPWTVNAEIYPLWARSTGNGIGAMTAWICNLVTSASFLSMVALIENFGVFYLMSSVALIGAIFCYFLQPETKNKSLEEIEALFISNKPNY